MIRVQGSFLHYLYPCLETTPLAFGRYARPYSKKDTQRYHPNDSPIHDRIPQDHPLSSHLNPLPTDYGRTLFADKATLTLAAGSGGHGCISFLREKYIEFGPANGGDGGSGGSIYIQAVRGETSLHKLAKRSLQRAGRGQNGQGKGKGGARGDDVLVQVPVGTVVREIGRHDPVAEEEGIRRIEAGAEERIDEETRGTWRRDKWILYPSASMSEYATAEFPPLPRSRKSNLAIAQPKAPISLDLSEPMERPMLLVAGAVGGLGNPHFVSMTNRRPKFATKGEAGASITIELELKLLADVGFVGMPNAGKSTLLRALSRSKARVGDWAFTTLQPNIGTMVLDNNHGRPQVQAYTASGEPRTQISIADIPGLIKDAHKDKGLGLGFLRHVERAHVLAFVVDLSAGDAVESLNALWSELGQFETLQSLKTNMETEARVVDWKPLGSSISSASADDRAMAGQNEHIEVGHSRSGSLPALPMAPISTKPWFVVATKADIDETQKNFAELQAYLNALKNETVDHPSKRKNAWKGPLAAIPVSAMRGEGVERIPEWTVRLLDS